MIPKTNALNSGISRQDNKNPCFWIDYETITPVNTFRIILRDYFKKDIDLLPDILYSKITNDLEAIPSTCEK